MTVDDFRSRNPHLAKFWPYLDLLEKESERGKVLISCGFLETQLRDVLLAFMIDSAAASDLLEGANAPLGTFSSRITACFALGLISEQELADLTVLRRIRHSDQLPITRSDQSLRGASV